MVGDDHVDNVCFAAGHNVHVSVLSREPMADVVARVDVLLHLVTERLQGIGGRFRGPSCRFDVQHYVHIVGRPHRVAAVVNRVHLGHQSANESPAVRGQDSGELSDVRPWVRPPASC